MNTFTNPIVGATPPAGAADPSVVYRDGYYYYCKSLDDGAIGIAKAERLQDIGKVPMLPVWTAPRGTAYSKQVWAPELQYLQGRWYIYFAASDGNNATHRMYTLESRSQDPQGDYAFRGKLADSTDQWAIDGTTFEHGGRLYLLWSGWRDDSAGFPQVTYIARMRNPWTLEGPRHEISAPDRDWERHGAALQEGHAVLKHDGRIFIVYSASGSWTDEYQLGLLSFEGGDVLDASAWRKHDAPVFTKAPAGGSFGPGHNVFTTSPDGSEHWIVYHAIDKASGGWTERSVRAQAFGWNADGTPDFGRPVAVGKPISAPSGTGTADVAARRSAERERIAAIAAREPRIPALPAFAVEPATAFEFEPRAIEPLRALDPSPADALVRARAQRPATVRRAAASG